MVNNSIEKKQSDRIAIEKERIEIYFKYNYKDIHNITITDVGTNPMGTDYIDGYANGDEKLDFSASLYDKHFENGVVVSAELGELAKFDVDKSVSEIKELD